MRLPSDARIRVLALVGLTAAIGGCALIPGGGDRVASADPAPAAIAENGPQADFPMVLGDSFTIDGEEYVPADTPSYDAVGYATLDAGGGQGVTLAHKTLPMPSYVEVTSLETGRTILARVERRGPMTNDRLVALSPAAQAQLGSRDGTPVRVRRVNPPEAERAELRADRAVEPRMDTPKTLLSVLVRKLPGQGDTSPRSADAAPQPNSEAAPVTPAPRNEQPVRMAEAETGPPSTPETFEQAFGGDEPRTVTSYPLRPLSNVPIAVAQPGPKPLEQVAATTRPQPAPAPAASPEASPEAGDFVIQAAAFSSKANADRAAGTLGGFVTRSGRFYRVRTGPYATRGQAEAALAKVRAAGYSDARVFTAG